MNRIIEIAFRDDQSLDTRAIVGLGLLAYAMYYVGPWLGMVGYLAYPLLILLIAAVTHTVFLHLMPLMDPRHDSADRFSVWGGAVLYLLAVAGAFGLLFIPGLLLGLGLLYWRAPDLLQVFPWFEGRGAGMDRFDRL